MAETAVEIDRYAHAELHAFVVAVFERLNVPRADAELAADALIAADVTGVDSHGVARLAGHPSYVPGLRDGRVNPRPNDRVIGQRDATALYDGDGGLGVVVSTRAMRVAIGKAERAGAGIVAVTNSRHFGIAAHYARMALPHGMIGLSMTNSFPQVAQPGGAGPTLGTNPISIAAPAGDEPPFVLDMATSVGAAGKADLARRAGKSMPDGWLVDARGRATTDPNVLFVEPFGALLPLGSFPQLGSHKGYGLAVAVDVLCGVLSGAGYGAILDPQSWSTGHFFAAIRIDAFRALPGFRAMMDEMIRFLRGVPRVPGLSRMRVHGEPEWETERERRERGIPLHHSVVASLRALEADLGVRLPDPIG
ncbi:MAG TPA: Ldh family oxidoreductase [Chloroflexota bacterium]|jgi:LDH2 family malate/lactate/ureidoglycolate dehydrogenase